MNTITTSLKNRIGEIHSVLKKTISLLMLSVVSMLAFAQSYPPSCAVMVPHSNAYYKQGTDVIIKVYASDIGKSTNNGTVSAVEFFVDGQKIGEETSHSNYTYTFVWGCVTAGEYRITAKATNNRGVSFTSTGVYITVGAQDVTPHGISAGKGKYLANIIAGSPARDYNKLWNGVTAENNCKWGVVESTRDQYNWRGADVSYDHAKNNYMMFRYHAAVWASQYPSSWLPNLSMNEARAEAVEYMEDIAQRYKYMDQIDVLNEQLGNHQRDNQMFRELFGGPGTGQNDFGWQIWLFEEARRIFPDTKLVLNDYGLVNDRNAINMQLNLLKVLRDRGLVDGFGTQSHCFNVDGISASFLQESLDIMTSAGVPIYVTELDLNGGVENDNNTQQQLKSYQDHFPVYWEHPAVAGITLWGYINGSTWRGGTGILSSSGVEKPALTWMKEYIGKQKTVGYPFYQTEGCTPDNGPRVQFTSPSVAVVSAGEDVTVEVAVEDTDNNVINVEFFVDDQKIGEDASAPYAVLWTADAEGSIVISAVASDADGNTGKANKQIKVLAPQAPYGGVAHSIPGTIEFEEFDTGGPDSAYYDIDAGTNVDPAPNFRTDEDVDIEVCIDEGGGYNLGWTAAGEWTEYTVDVKESGFYSIEIRAASNGAGKTISFSMDDQIIAQNIEIPNTGGWQDWETVTVDDIELRAGVQVLRMTIGDANYVNLNTMSFLIRKTEPVSISLVKGWNEIEYPLEGSVLLEDAFASIWGEVQVVKDQNVFFDKILHPDFCKLKKIESGVKYLILVHNDCELIWK